MLFKILYILFWFSLILTAVVFLHEMGHYLIGRLFGVKVEEFSIGFGRELIGFNSKSGTRWKICAIPLGGYVKFFGDDDIASVGKNQSAAHNKELTMQHKPAWQRLLIALGGPLFNYITAFCIFFGMFLFAGKLIISTEITGIIPDSPAQEAGLAIGDVVTHFRGEEVADLLELKRSLMLNIEKEVEITINRDGKELDLSITPMYKDYKDDFGNKERIPLIGFEASNFEKIPLTLRESAYESLLECYSISAAILKTLKQMILGQRSVRELGSPIKIAQYSGKFASQGFASILLFVAMISVSLGLFNLFPIPVLDGGHILFSLYEMIVGKPISNQAQKIMSMAGLTLLLTLTAFVIISDIQKLLM